MASAGGRAEGLHKTVRYFAAPSDLTHSYDLTRTNQGTVEKKKGTSAPESPAGSNDNTSLLEIAVVGAMSMSVSASELTLYSRSPKVPFYAVQLYIFVCGFMFFPLWL